MNHSLARKSDRNQISGRKFGRKFITFLHIWCPFFTCIWQSKLSLNTISILKYIQIGSTDWFIKIRTIHSSTIFMNQSLNPRWILRCWSKKWLSTFLMFFLNLLRIMMTWDLSNYNVNHSCARHRVESEFLVAHSKKNHHLSSTNSSS